MKRSWFSRHPLCFMALYLILYLSAFNFLNTQIHMPHILVHCRLDDLIPFCKYAAIPYFAWFPWIPFTLFFLLWKAPREDYLASAARPGDLILTVGAGDVYKSAERLVARKD